VLKGGGHHHVAIAQQGCLHVRVKVTQLD
jgi:hypothetical protein